MRKILRKQTSISQMYERLIQMKKTVFAVLTTVMTIGAVSPAFAWGFDHCRNASNVGISSTTLAKHCSNFIVGEGIISSGKYENQIWKQKFDWADFKSVVTDDDVEIGETIDVDSAGLVKGHDYYVSVGKEDSIRTKQIKSKDFDGWNSKLDINLSDYTTLDVYGEGALQYKYDNHIYTDE